MLFARVLIHGSPTLTSDFCLGTEFDQDGLGKVHSSVL